MAENLEKDKKREVNVELWEGGVLPCLLVPNAPPPPKKNRFAQWWSTSLIEISGFHLSAHSVPSLLHFFFSPLNLCWLIAFRACMAVTNCITSGVTSGRDH